MKFEHSISGISRVSFSTREQINPVTNTPTGVLQENWEEIPHATAMGLEELQKRMEALEALVGNAGTGAGILELAKFVDSQEKKPQKPPKEAPPPGKPLSKIPKGKRGPKPKKEAPHE